MADWTGYNVVYVRQGGSGDGSSPEQAFGTFQAAFGSIFATVECQFPALGIVFDIGVGNFGDASSPCSGGEWAFGIRGQGAGVSTVGSISCINGVNSASIRIVSDRTVTIGDINLLSDNNGGNVRLNGVICGNINTYGGQYNAVATMGGNVSLNNSTSQNINTYGGPNTSWTGGGIGVNGANGGSVTLTNNSTCANINTNGGTGGDMDLAIEYCPPSQSSSSGGPPGAVSIDGTSAAGTITSNSGQDGHYTWVVGCNLVGSPNYCPYVTDQGSCIPSFGRNGVHYTLDIESGSSYQDTFTGLDSDYGYCEGSTVEIFYQNGTVGSGGWYGKMYTDGRFDCNFNGLAYDYGLNGYCYYTNGNYDSVVFSNIIYADRFTGNDETGDGTIDNPFFTVERAWNLAVNYYNNTGTLSLLYLTGGDFGGISISNNIRSIANSVLPIAIIGHGASVGGINSYFADLTLKIYSNKSAELGDINIIPVYDPSGSDTLTGNAGELVLINCNAYNISGNGGHGNDIPNGPDGGNGANIKLFNSRVRNISINGGNGFGEYVNCYESATVAGGPGTVTSVGSTYGTVVGSRGTDGYTQWDCPKLVNGGYWGQYYVNGVPLRGYQMSGADNTFTGISTDCCASYGICAGLNYLFVNGVATTGAWREVLYDRQYGDRYSNQNCDGYCAVADGIYYDYFYHKYVIYENCEVKGLFTGSFNGKMYYDGRAINGAYSGRNYTDGIPNTDTGISTDVSNGQTVLFINGFTVSGYAGYNGHLFYNSLPSTHTARCRDYAGGTANSSVLYLFVNGSVYNGYYNNDNIYYINGLRLVDWFFTNQTNDASWATLENWTSQPDGGGFSPQTPPWTDSSTSNHNLYYIGNGNINSDIRTLGGARVGGDFSSFKITGTCDRKIGEVLIANGLQIIASL